MLLGRKSLSSGCVDRIYRSDLKSILKMDPTVEFFAKLKKLAVTLESETGRLQQEFETRKSEDDSDKSSRAMRAYHEVNCDVSTLKGQIQEQLVRQKAKESEVNRFIEECKIMKERISQDICTLKEHWENYGYQAPNDTQKTASRSCHESATADKAADENEAKTAGEVEEGCGEDEAEDAEGIQPTPPIVGEPPPVSDVLRTPQLSDFGLSEMGLKKGLAGSDWSCEEPPMPQFSLPQSFNRPGLPPKPVTPKCALWLDDDEPQTPKLHEFAISEPTMFLLNDFTMDLFKKNVQKPQRPIEDIPVPENPLSETLQPKDDLDSPEMPEFCPLGFNIKKSNCFREPAAQIIGKPGSSHLRGEIATPPKFPEPKSQYLKQLLNAKKVVPISVQANGSHVFNLPTPPRKGSLDSKLPWEYDVPQISIPGGGEQQMPVMPRLESALAKSLQSKATKMSKNGGEHEGLTRDHNPDLDGQTQEFSLGTPCLRRTLEEPNTPEMPDFSSITQDICKLLPQAQLKKRTMMVVQPNIQTDKNGLHKAVSMVSDLEYQNLPKYLKLMTLHNLNQAIHNINTFMADYSGEKTEFQVEELQRIVNAGIQTPVIILCLTELKKLTHVGGVKNSAVYKLNMHN